MMKKVKKLGSLLVLTSFVASVQLTAGTSSVFADAKKSCCKGKKATCNKKKHKDCDCQECQSNREAPKPAGKTDTPAQ